VLFTTTGHSLIFEPQFLCIKTALPRSTNIYGLGEHSEPFRLDVVNTTRTLWARDAYAIPQGTNYMAPTPFTLSIAPPAAPMPCFFSARQAWT
jgi:alpha-glucosidase